MRRILILIFCLLTLSACGGGGESTDGNNNQGGSGEQNDGNNTPVLASQLTFDGNQLPAECEFDNNQLRSFSQCNPEFSISLLSGSAQGASFVGQVSEDGGISWQNVTTDNNRVFVVDLVNRTGNLSVRALMQFDGEQTVTDVVELQILDNSIEILSANDFAVAKTLYLKIEESQRITLPSCRDPQDDKHKVILSLNGRFLLEQSSGVTIPLNAKLFKQNDVISASCQDDLGAIQTAPGSLQISFANNPNNNQPPVVSFLNLDDTTKYFSGKIRDQQLLDICVFASDAEGQNLTATFNADIESTSQTNQTETIDLTANGLCTQLETHSLGNNKVTINAAVTDGLDETPASLSLGVIHQDTLPLASAQNSSCLVGEAQKTVPIDIPRDTEFDVFSVAVVDAQSGELLKTLEQTESASITFSCQQAGLTRYQLTTSSRDASVSSITYSHSVTNTGNQAPELAIDVEGERVGLLYRDNQDLQICIDAQDADNDVLTSELAYQWGNGNKANISLTDNCAELSTQGRGGQKLILFASANDGQTQVEKSLNLNTIHSDTIQFAVTQSNSCIEGNDNLLYSISLPADSEGDSHTLDVLDLDSQTVLHSLGAVNNGSFELSCQTVGQQAFVLLTRSRGLSVVSTNYLHTVTEAENLEPEVSYTLEGEQIGQPAELNFRDNQNISLCVTGDDPEGQPVSVSGRFGFNGNLDNVINLQNNCQAISLFDRGGQTLQIDIQGSDGEVQNNLDPIIINVARDTIQVASSQSQTCEIGDSSLTYTVAVPDDTEGDNNQLLVLNANDNAVISSLGVVDSTASFSLPCNTLGTTEFYIRNQSRGLTTFSRIYNHTVDSAPNQPPRVTLVVLNAEMIGDELRDNQNISACAIASDEDGDNLTTTLHYRLDDDEAQQVSLNSGCGEISLDAAGNRTIQITASTSDGSDSDLDVRSWTIHQDTLPFAYSQSQTCRQGDAARIYTVNMNADVEGDEFSLAVYHATNNQLITSLGSSVPATFSLACNSNGVTPFVIRNTSRGLSSFSTTYQHVVAAENNTAPQIVLSIDGSPQRFNGALRDEQSIRLCAQVSDAENDNLNTQVFYRFDNQTQQTLTLNNLCGDISLIGRGGQSLIIEGFSSDGTATGNDTLNAGRIYLDTIQTPVSGSGSCRAGDAENIFSVRVTADVESDPYSIDVVDAISNQVLRSLGQITQGTFSLPCDEENAIDFVLRNTSRNKVQNSLIYSHVVGNTLNAKPQLEISINQAEQFSGQVRDGQEIEVCLSGSDADGDALTYSASYQFSSGSFQSLILDTNQCGTISTRQKGGQTLLIQGFVNDGIAQTTQLEEVGEIHTDTLAIAETVSSDCSLGEQAIEYSIVLETDAQGDQRQIRVVEQANQTEIAQFLEGDTLSFSLPCDAVGQTEFIVQTVSRDLTQDSEVYIHTVNPNLTNQVNVWLTRGDGSQLLSEQNQQILRAGTGTATHQIDVSDAQPKQIITGLGANLTDSAASLIYQSAQANSIVERIFSAEQGINLQHLRVPMSGMGEFISRAARSYDDVAVGLTDPELEQFSIGDDEDYLLPLLSTIKNENPEIELHAVSWSAPAWMKDNSSLNGGSLRVEFYQSYANYFAKFLTAYEDAGLTFDSISLQNQPHLQDTYPSMLWALADYELFFQDFFFPAMSALPKLPDIWVWDGNWTDFDSQADFDIALFAENLMDNDFIYARARAIAMQCYQADNGASDYTQAIENISDLPRTRDVYLTSCRNREDGRSFGQYLTATLNDFLLPVFQAGAKGIFYDSLALDVNNGPQQGGCTDCRALVTIDNAGNMQANAEYYAFGHISKFLQSGAVLIEAVSGNAQVQSIAFKNPDNTIVTVVLNLTADTQEVDINWQGQSTHYQLNAYDVVTFVWDSDNSPVVDLQKIAQANALARDLASVFDAMRDTNGLYIDQIELNSTDERPRSVATTGLALVALSIAQQMEWDSSAATKVLNTLEVLNGGNENIVLSRNADGMFASQLDASGAAILNSQGEMEFSVTDTMTLVAGVHFVRNAFSNNGLIREAADIFLTSVTYDNLIENTDSGLVVTTQNAQAETLQTQGVYNQQMLTVWLAMNYDNSLAAELWQRYYATGQQFPIRFYDGYAMPANEDENSISATLHQLNYYLLNSILNSANYRQLFASHANAEKSFWLDAKIAPAYVWGFALPDSLDVHSSNRAHPAVIAGFIPANNNLLDDLLLWQDNNLAILATQVNGIEIPWAYQADDPNSSAQQIKAENLAVMLFGLAAHPGLLDIQFFRVNNDFEFTPEE
ncbi:glycoside hydrolase family 30 protein [Catenovulum sediminis]|uniref:glycoside hydrolase family 30 protein n=1 Tax=Catenovulum sediminis TaxID=1740262 RepID=UPI00117D1B81|nr:glycoside hydrolase family 30 beta sandwich domain-containing protein [Catenovulum sediminis]